MNRKRFEPSPATVAAIVGLLALASAMGIGRFSLTPIMPLMQRDIGLTLAEGSWLATANYLGYLTGALICMAFAPRPERAIRILVMSSMSYMLEDSPHRSRSPRALSRCASRARPSAAEAA